MKKILVLVGTIGMLAVPVAVAQDLDVNKLTENNAIIQTVKSGFEKNAEVAKNEESSVVSIARTDIPSSVVESNEVVNGTQEKGNVATMENKEVKIKDEKTNTVVELGPNDIFGIVGPVAGVETEEEKVEFQAKWDAMMAQKTVKDEETNETVVELGANDLFGLVGPIEGVETPEQMKEFQEKWDAMMAQRTVPVEQVTTTETTTQEQEK